MRKILFTVLFFGNHLFACECPSLEKINKTDCERYDVIFMGTVDSVSACNGKAQAWFSVASIFKGEIFQQTSVQFDCSSDCMMSFESNERWIIYAKYYSYGKIETDLCSHSRKFAKDKKQDFYSEHSGLSFEDELKFLTDNFGWGGKLHKKTDNNKLHRENIQPSATGKMILVIVSMFALILFYFLANKFWKS